MAVSAVETGAVDIGRRRQWAAVAASVVGFAFDLFDLFILLFVASVVGELLFPTTSETLSLAAVYASFAVSLVMRPLGAVLFGPYADSLGRKRLLKITTAGAGVSTALMGAVPTFAAAGYVGPIGFILLRLVQGLFIGGIVASTHTLATETVPQKIRGAISGLVGGGGPAVGSVLASVASLILHRLFPGAAFSGWGWRFMFFTGLLGALLSFWVLRAAAEPPSWRRPSAGDARRPIATLLDHAARRSVLQTLVVIAGAGTSYYLTSGYLPTIYQKFNRLDGAVASNLLLWSSVTVVVGTVAAGALSDVWGRRRTLIFFGVVDIVVVPFVYWTLIRLGPTEQPLILLLSLILVFFSNAIYGPAMIYVNENFPTRVRATGTAFVWNGGFALGGLMTTLVTLSSPTLGDIPKNLIAFLVAWYAIFVVAVLVGPGTRDSREEGRLLRR